MTTEKVPLSQQHWFTHCGYCDGDVYHNIGGGVNTVDNGDGTKSRFHMVDCWPRARMERTGQDFITCVECGKASANEWIESVATRLAEKSLCHDCGFWDEWVERADRGDDDKIVRVDGNHYHIGDEMSSSLFRGFGGRKFVIRFHDGREVTSTNLWGQGDIPAHFRKRLPDNAEFVKYWETQA